MFWRVVLFQFQNDGCIGRIDWIKNKVCKAFSCFFFTFDPVFIPRVEGDQVDNSTLFEISS